jgi:hypothetical protein
LTNEREEYFKAYSEYSKVLRTWFVAYGIGAPVLLLTNDTIAKVIKTSGGSKEIAAFFLAGVALQVSLAALNKMSMWGLYYGELQSAFKQTRRYKACFWFSEQFWIDLAIDLVTLLFFIVATWRSYEILGS